MEFGKGRGSATLKVRDLWNLDLMGIFGDIKEIGFWCVTIFRCKDKMCLILFGFEFFKF